MTMSKRTRRRLTFGVIAGSYAAGTVWAMRRGYSFGRNVTVRCLGGHAFQTIWIPGVSVKSLRLGLWRLQWCPVGRHVSLVHLVKPADLTPDMRWDSARHHDIPVP
jgi:hypothetical protein